MTRTVAIDCFPESVTRYADGHAFVAIDVIRATTTAVTAAATGRRCFPVPTLEAAMETGASLTDPILAGEIGGKMPLGFDMNNSPAQLHARTDIGRPVVLLSTSGTRLIAEAAVRGPVILACFRNYVATARHLTDRYSRVAVIGAGSREEFREEDQMCCAWLAELLVQAGYEPQDGTARLIERWSGTSPEACLTGKSAAYLRRSNQVYDLDFIVSRVDDLDAAFPVVAGEVRTVVEPRRRASAPALAAATA